MRETSEKRADERPGAGGRSTAPGDGRQGGDRGAERRNETVARRYVEEVLIGRNVDAIEELFAPPGDWVEISLYDDAAVASYDEMKRYYRERLPEMGEDFTIESVVADGDEVMVRWTATVRVTRDLPGIPATGKPFETTAVSTFGFEDGRIVELHVHINELNLLPEVAWPAVRGILGEMQDGVVVVDDDGRIVHANPAVADLFDRDREALLGESVETLVGEGGCAPTVGECDVALGPDGGRYFSVSASPLTGGDGERIGRMLVLRDVTERRRRIQQLEVLNRVLRHDLRNALQVVRGRLDVARERADDPVASVLEPARERADRLLATAETARHVRAALAETETLPQDLGTIASTLVERARDRYPDARVEATIAGNPTVEAPTATADALWELVENACEHGGERPRVDVVVDARGGTAELAVVDDGPGLPDHEREVLDAGGETDLEHGSGLGLWLAHWVIDAAGGTLGFGVEDGTMARVTLPLAATEGSPTSSVASVGD